MLNVIDNRDYFNTLITFWSNSCGELYDENHENIESGLLPSELLYVFEYWWSDSYYSSCRLAEYDGKYGIALISVYDEEYIKETGISIEDVIRKAKECSSAFSEYNIFAFTPPIEPFVNEEPAIMLFIHYNKYDIGYKEIEQISSKFDDICYCIMTDNRKEKLVKKLFLEDKADELLGYKPTIDMDEIEIMKAALLRTPEEKTYALYRHYVCGAPKLPEVVENEEISIDLYTPNIVTITAIERDGFDVRILTVNLNVIDENINVKKAISDACREYITTPEGKRVYENNGDCFNLADFEVNVPNIICKRYGFEKITSQMADYCLDWDEQLV